MSSVVANLFFHVFLLGFCCVFCSRQSIYIECFCVLKKLDKKVVDENHKRERKKRSHFVWGTIIIQRFSNVKYDLENVAFRSTLCRFQLHLFSSPLSLCSLSFHTFHMLWRSSFKYAHLQIQIQPRIKQKPRSVYMCAYSF